MLVEINNTTKAKIDIASVKKIAEKFLKLKKIKQDLSVAFVGDSRMRTLNRKYRKKDKTTDILSFEGESRQLGEIIINFAQIIRQAKKQKTSVKYELDFILIHGLLHLTGMVDEAEKDRLNMIEEGKKLINKFYGKPKKVS